MPLARIFTRNPERTVDLSSQLQQQGYKVEVASPDQKHLAPADLEIEFELCERADVLERAADLANELEADVAVGPGVLQVASEPLIEPILAVPAQPAAESAVEIQPYQALNNQVLNNQTLKSDAEREFEAAFSPKPEIPEVPAAMHATAEVIEIPIMEQAQSPAPMPPVAFMEEPAIVDSVKMEPVKIAKKPAMEIPVHFAEPAPEQARSADPVPYLSQLTPFSSPVARTETQVSQSVRSQEKAVQVSDRSNQVLQDGAKIAAKTWAGAQALASSTADSVRDHFREYKKRAQVRSAEQRAAHAARLLDLEQRRAEAQQKASELEAARVAASVRLNELLQQRAPGLPEQRQTEQRRSEQNQPEENQREHGLWQPSTYAHTVPKEDRNREVPAAASYRPTPPVSPAAKSAQAAVKNTPAALWSNVNPPLRAVLTGAAAVSALFIMGIALGIFHSRAPLASPANHASSGVTEESGAVPVQTGETAQTALTKPGPETGSQSAAQTEAKTQSSAKPSPRVQRAAQLASQQAETNIGDDVIIRHFSRPVPTQKPKQTGQQAGLKHFSDLDN
ncbi:MAG TPA: hypothetical protein VGK22_19345 [Candidatus Angelobacter sp.]|jgi:hypothetical protein